MENYHLRHIQGFLPLQKRIQALGNIGEISGATSRFKFKRIVAESLISQQFTKLIVIVVLDLPRYLSKVWKIFAELAVGDDIGFGIVNKKFWTPTKVVALSATNIDTVEMLGSNTV
ncbi:hypothetical protein [Microbulbifer sp. VAAF005]|uniref:hypothetical protein n=1 Tax=Microbulbifer sp. VAAF005 TaxID=3034230 RepID=UPI0024AD46D0|nr:hypothetical protein [Microbulbifer sp. VAAF005]WHI47334.1 hypothetical protein P0078_02840 [Microbulbifer sp. VAAF005]